MTRRSLPKGLYRCSGPRPAKAKPYRAMIVRFPRLFHLGTYATAEEAHAAYLAARARKKKYVVIYSNIPLEKHDLRKQPTAGRPQL